MLCIIDGLFLALSMFVIITAPLVIYFEEYAPAVLLKLCNYGSFAYKGSKASYIRAIEMPRSYYKHFYMNASVLSVATLFYMVCVYFGEVIVDDNIVFVVKVLMGDKEPVSVYAALLATCLLTLQSVKRMYETRYLQVFAKTSTMNAVHYFMGIVHYTFGVIGILGHAPLFNGYQDFTWIDTPTTLISVPCIFAFFWASAEQYRSNIILAKLRKNKKGSVVTDAYAIPRGRWFELVSSPHRACELVLYAALLCILRTDTYFYVLIWVLVNQCEMAIQAHKWYNKEFENYPKERKAIIPFLL